MSLAVNHLYEFGEFRLDTREKILTRGGEPLELTPKGFELLSLLVENQGRLLGKDELMDKIWADSFVEEGNLTFNIRQLRKLLGDDAHRPKYIKTVRRHGYRFIAEVNPVSAIEAKPAPEKIAPTAADCARQPEGLAALNASDARMHALASNGEMIYRAARGRWLWLTSAGPLPAALLGDAWQTQLVGRWNCPPAAAAYGDTNRTAAHQGAAEYVARDSAARLSVARAIATRMETVLGRRVPPIDNLDLVSTRSRRLRVDRAAELNSAHNLARPMPAAAVGHLNAKPPAPALAKQQRWRYPI